MFIIGAKWEHDRIDALESQQQVNTDRLARIEEKIDALGWKLERVKEAALENKH